MRRTQLRPGRMSTARWRAVAVAAAIGLAAAVAPLSAAQADSSVQLSARQAVARKCFGAPAGRAPGVATLRRTADVTGLIRVRLDGGGDWDVAVFDAGSKAVVAASAGFGGIE